MAEPVRHGAPLEPWKDPAAKPFLRVENVTKTFGKVYACDDISLDVYRGEFFALLGGSGSGKSTLLRILAGFETPDRGRVLIDGVDVTAMPPYARPVNMMFQSYALFPHMTVAQNIAFGLEMQGKPKTEIAATVEKMLALVKLPDVGNRRADQLSGGQQQRIALARALASRPRVLLLDESLSALDMKLRKDMQIELKRLQAETGITFIFVTHDQEEALTMSDRIAVMSKGRILQVGTPNEIYERPLNRTVADFIGETNFLEADPFAGGARLADGQVLSLAGMPESGRITLAIRPERVSLTESGNLAGEVEEVVYIGTDTLYLLKVAGQSGFRVRQQNRAGSGQPLPRGAQVRLDVPAAAIRVLGE